ncbi:hypothetical protein PMIN06_000940 [Paraphaeosphaeria minitans]
MLYEQGSHMKHCRQTSHGRPSRFRFNLTDSIQFNHHFLPINTPQIRITQILISCPLQTKTGWSPFLGLYTILAFLPTTIYSSYTDFADFKTSYTPHAQTLLQPTTVAKPTPEPEHL